MLAPIVVLASHAFLGGCAANPQFDPLDPGRSIQELEALASSVNLESQAWRDQVDQVVRTLTDELHQAIANDLAALVDGAIQATAAEVRCTSDFYRARLEQSIRGLLATLQGEQPQAPDPSICTILPPSIDLNMAPNRLRPLVISGYDLRDLETHAANIRLIAVFGNGLQRDATRLLALQSPYQGTISVGQDDGCFLISNNVRRLRVMDGTTEVGSVAVTMPALVPEEATGVWRTLEFFPGRDAGDKDFGTNPIDKVVRVNLKVETRIHDNKVQANVFMDAREWNKNSGSPAGDQTRASGTSDWVTIYTPPAGRRIASMVTAREDNPATYNQEGHGSQTRTGSTDLVDRYIVTTDGPFDDIGEDDGDRVRTGVKVFFEPVKVTLEPINPWCP